jgi:hypothetical protein
LSWGNEKVKAEQAILVKWDNIKDSPPPQLKILPIAAIPYKSKAFWSILNLLFTLHLTDGSVWPSVNDTMIKTTPHGAIDQLGRLLSWMIHVFAEVEENIKIFMAKWDVKDSFWRMDCQEGKQWNFAYVLPQLPGMPVILVIPSSLQMGWLNSCPFSVQQWRGAEISPMQYHDTKVGSLTRHKFEQYLHGNESFQAF